MVLIRCPGEKITGTICHQGNIGFRVEVSVIEGKGAYWRSHFESGIYFIPHIDTRVSRSGLYQGWVYQKAGRKEGEVRKDSVRRLSLS